MAYWVYILQSEPTGRYYIGQTHDPPNRLHRHNADRTQANRGRGPWRLVYSEEWPTRQAAVARERAIKARKSRAYIDTLRGTGPVG